MNEWGRSHWTYDVDIGNKGVKEKYTRTILDPGAKQRSPQEMYNVHSITANNYGCWWLTISFQRLFLITRH